MLHVPDFMLIFGLFPLRFRHQKREVFEYLSSSLRYLILLTMGAELTQLFIISPCLSPTASICQKSELGKWLSG